MGKEENFAMALGQKYPIGIQTFSEIREKGLKYIDKTAHVFRMTHSGYKYAFLSRPRRFGKSLLVSTLQSYFEGHRELFSGLSIEKTETEWAEYPVLHFDLSQGKHTDVAGLERYLSDQLSVYEKKFDSSVSEKDSNIRLRRLIMTVFEKTGKQVVVLVDEYDAPLLDVVHEDETLSGLRDVLRNFYSPLKACDPYLRFVFLTGITKFSQLSIFSELNNIKNISMLPEFADVCGITEDEMDSQLFDDIVCLSESLNISREKALSELKSKYDGYHFTLPSPDIYNPYSLLNALADKRLNSYWFESGTPSYLIEMLKKFGVVPSKIGGMEVMADDFDAPTERMTNIVPLLYQSGYITIKSRDDKFGSYILDIPNNEVRIGLMNSLIPDYVSQDEIATKSTMRNFARAVFRDDINGAFKEVQTFLGTIPYCDNANSEGHFQQLLYVMFSLLGYYVDIEVRTPKGRVDMVFRSSKTLYVIELKVGKSSIEALSQIDVKDYPARFANCGLPVVKVGANFSLESRNLSDWQITESPS